MDKAILLELIGIPVIFFGGSIFHFLYKYGGRKKWMAIISPVNESIWEHLKIAFYPALIFSVFQALVWVNYPINFFTAEIAGIYSMMFFILIAEWIYPTILKKNVLFLDLLVFFVAISLSQFVSYALFSSTGIYLPEVIIILIISLQIIIFAVLTFWPLKLPLFRDSVDGKFGIK